MKHMIDAEKFLDKLLYMGYMDEQKSEVEEVANGMTEDAYTKDEVITMFEELKTEIEELEKPRCHNASHADGCVSKWRVEGTIQSKIDSLKENKGNE